MEPTRDPPWDRKERAKAGARWPGQTPTSRSSLVRLQLPENTAKVCLEEAVPTGADHLLTHLSQCKGGERVLSIGRVTMVPSPCLRLGTTHSPRILISSTLCHLGLLDHVTEFNNGTLWGWGGGLKKWNF